MSGKRSKWAELQDDEDDSQATPQKRTRRALSPSRKAGPDPASSSVAGGPAQAGMMLGKRTHSIYVPPRTEHPGIVPSRSVYAYERLNQIEEGSYGVVYRARDKETGDIVALKRLKLDEEKHGFPITALREINALMQCRHENVVNIREVVVGDTLTQYALPCSRGAVKYVQSVHCNGLYRA